MTGGAVLRGEQMVQHQLVLHHLLPLPKNPLRTAPNKPMPDYSGELAQARQQDKTIKIPLRKILPALIAQRMAKAIEHKESWVWPLIFIIAAFNDVFDILGIGAIPIFGDFIDVFSGIILTLLFWNIGEDEERLKWKIRIAIWLATALEVILGIFILPEFIPFWLICVWYARHKVNKKAKIAERGLGKAKAGKIDREAVAEFR